MRLLNWRMMRPMHERSHQQAQARREGGLVAGEAFSCRTRRKFWGRRVCVSWRWETKWMRRQLEDVDTSTKVLAHPPLVPPDLEAEI
jgi:hypothetical protein